MPGSYVIGVDFGTDSVRSIIVDAINGEEITSSVFYYPCWKEVYIAILRSSNSGNTHRIMLMDWSIL